MRMGSQIDRHPVGKERHVGPVIRIEAAQKILIGLPCAAGMFHRNEAGNQAKNLSRSALRLQHIFLVGNELLRGGGDRSIGQTEISGTSNSGTSGSWARAVASVRIKRVR